MKEDYKATLVRFFNIALVVSFLCIIFFPLIDHELGLNLDKIKNTEKRNLAKRPHFSIDSIETFPSRYDNYYNDNFSFRNFLVKLNSVITSKAYDLSAIPDVLIGKDGWLFYISKDQGNSREDYMGRLHVNKITLDSIRAKLEQRSRELKLKGIRFLVTIAPDKHSIYPDFLPSNIGKRGRYPTRLDQIIFYLKKNSSVQILDLRDALIKGRDTEPIPSFKMTDTHWNYFGGFLAYQEIMRSLSMIPKQKTDFKWDIIKTNGLDLAGMLGASDQFKEDNEIAFTPLFPNDLTFTKIDNYEFPMHGNVVISANKDQSLPKLLMFHDSFGGSIQPFLAYHFRESVFITDRYSTAEIIKEKPDIVIVEIVERYVDQMLPAEEF